MLQELKEGRGPCWIDFRLPDLHKQLREFRGSSFDRILKQIELTGVTLDKVIAELIIGIINDQGGGIRINPDCETTLPGLCAAGVASDMGCAPSHTLVCGQIGAAATGHRAGESAAKYALAQSKFSNTDSGQVSQLKSSIYKPLKCKQGVKPDEIRMSLVESWVNIDVRDETRLKKAQEQLKEIEKEASNLFVDDCHELVKCHKTRNLLECSQAVADAALVRRETRLTHIRQDYPLTDNKNWLKWVITRRIGDKLHTDVEDIPIQRWKYKPEPTLVDPLEPSKKEGSL
jgi:succinate dehydrogenase / fumarate reductase flavoprotein subunit